MARTEFGDERDPEIRQFLRTISPMGHSQKITEPVLIAHGLNDPRVPVGESEQIVEALRKNGGVVWYLLAKNEGHGFRSIGNTHTYENAVVLFLEKYLLR